MHGTALIQAGFAAAAADYGVMMPELLVFSLATLVIGGWLALMMISSALCFFHPVRKTPQRPVPEGEDGVYIVGHSTVLILMDGLRVMVDPNWSDSVGHVIRRFVTPPIPFEQLGRVDAVCLTHWHFDHFDRRTLKRFASTVPVIAPRSLHRALRRCGFSDIREARPFEGQKVGGIIVTPVPTEHRSAPDGVGYVFQGSKTVYHAGDTGLNKGTMREIGGRFKIDLALLPIGAYRGLPPMGWIVDFNSVHMSPEDAAEAMELLRAKRAAAIHHGVFRIMTEPVDEPAARMRVVIEKRNLEGRFLLPEVGRFVKLD